ncbi:hypothetical protein DICPUDRAFT_153814, partial [Dictyostelium purpureum]
MYSEDIQDELTKIQNLLESCFISQDEFNLRKSELLGTPFINNGNIGNPPKQEPKQPSQYDYSYNSDYNNNSNSYNNNNDTSYSSYNTAYLGNTTTVSATNNYTFDNYKEVEVEIPLIGTLSINDNNNKNNNNNYNNYNNNNRNNNYNYNKKYTYNNNNKKTEEPKDEKPGAFASMFLNKPASVHKDENFEDEEDEEDKMVEAPAKAINPVGDQRIDLEYDIKPYVVFKPLDRNSKKVNINLKNWVKDRNFSDNISLNHSVENWKSDKIKEQNSLRSKIIYDNVNNLSIKLNNCNIKLIGGCDISFPKSSKNDAVASIVVLEYPSLKVVYESYKMIKLTEPYVAGYLAFREVPHFIALWETLTKKYPQFKPDLMILDGNGINHQRSVGAATHFGILANIPTIGVAKNLLVAKGITPEYIQNGFKTNNIVEMIDYQDGKRLIGHAMYNKQKEIIYISPGHMMDANTAFDV